LKAIGIPIKISSELKNKEEDFKNKFLNKSNTFTLTFPMDMDMLMSFKTKNFGKGSFAMKSLLLL
jgi:hypothetical protein